MNWNYWLPWRDFPSEDNDSSPESRDIPEGAGREDLGRIIVNQSEQTNSECEYDVTD